MGRSHLRFLAPEGQQRLAHGVGRGYEGTPSQAISPGRGERGPGQNASFAPAGADYIVTAQSHGLRRGLNSIAAGAAGNAAGAAGKYASLG